MNDFKLGVMVYLSDNIMNDLMKVKEMGLSTCQLCCWEESLMTPHYTQLIKEAVKESGIEITAFWCGWPGPKEWNFYKGPMTLGLVPKNYRDSRLTTLLKGSDFAKTIDVQDVVTHVGFIPENPNDEDYVGVLEVVKYIGVHCKNNGQYFLFETGQETPITLKRLIEDTKLDNLGINLDPANLLLYGKANPIDALDIFGEYVRGVHAKDGEYPTNGRELGEEKPLGKGRVHFDLLLKKLKEIGYKGALTIEREINGEGQIKDILEGKVLLEKIMESL